MMGVVVSLEEYPVGVKRGVRVRGDDLSEGLDLAGDED